MNMNVNVKETKKYVLTEVLAVAYGDNEPQDAVLVHYKEDEFCDGDCLIFDASIDHLNSDEDVEYRLINECCPTYFDIVDDIYYANC